ncbi:MAG: hypothetical protein GOVbin4206_74 [Prokaryotic dsDNA virus sp.]|nr:MAG: hypothetical protein GOVbin4206_74 [Prokaryotic dsDNA virus sp.]|tara:strand:- start:2356 stop:2619 length:264 start_codon:yes stop_codon:yes gene_type:complete
MTWDYYNEKEIKKSDIFSMSMRVSVLLERNGEDVLPEEIGITERELHMMVEDILKQAIGEKYSTEVQDDEGEETLIEVTVEDIMENR